MNELNQNSVLQVDACYREFHLLYILVVVQYGNHFSGITQTDKCCHQTVQKQIGKL